MLTEVVFHRPKLHCGPWTEVVSHVTPPHLLKVKINFDEALSGFISTPRCDHEEEHQRHAAILVSSAFAFVFSWYKVIIALSLCFSTGPLRHTVHKSIVAAKIFSLNFFQAPIFRSRLEACSNKHSNTNPFNTKCRLQTNTAMPILQYKTQTGYKTQTENSYWFLSDTCNMSSYNLPSVTQSLFPRLSFTIICSIVEYSSAVSWSQSFLI